MPVAVLFLKMLWKREDAAVRVSHMYGSVHPSDHSFLVNHKAASGRFVENEPCSYRGRLVVVVVVFVFPKTPRVFRYMYP